MDVLLNLFIQITSGILMLGGGITFLTWGLLIGPYQLWIFGLIWIIYVFILFIIAMSTILGLG